MGSDGIRRQDQRAQFLTDAPVFEVGDGRYSWLRENLFVAEGRLTGAKAISYDIYRVL